MPLKGSITVPGDKSVSHRALMFSAITAGQSRITDLADNKDVLATRQCLETLGADIRPDQGALLVTGNPRWQKPAHRLDAMNSGTTIRLLSGLLAAQDFATTITGDESLRKRPMKRVIDPLLRMGAHIQSTDGHAPLTIEPANGKLKGITYAMPHASAQVKSALLLAGLYAKGDTVITEPVASRDHTERMLRFSGVHLKIDGNTITLPENQIGKLHAVDWQVPGDVSSAAFWMVAATLVKNSEVRIENVLLNPGRTGILTVLKSVGANIQARNAREACGEPVGDLIIKNADLKGNISLKAADIPALIDELPILAVAGVFLDGSLTVHGAEELRVKESDRIAAIAEEFGKLGIAVETFPDGFALYGQPDLKLQAPTIPLDSHHDHRIAMSLRILNTIAAPADRWAIMGEEHIAVSYPGFENTLAALS